MPRFKVQWDYRSSAGSFDKGAEVEVDDAVAEHINRDSPGVLKPVTKGKTKSDEAKTETPPDPDAVPDGSVDTVLEWVGDDLDRAAQALEAEEASDKPRTTLVEPLQEMLTAAVAGDDEKENPEQRTEEKPPADRQVKSSKKR